MKQKQTMATGRKKKGEHSKNIAQTHHIRPIHVRNLARRKGFGNVARVTGDPRLFALVQQTLLQYAQTPGHNVAIANCALCI